MTKRVLVPLEKEKERADDGFPSRHAESVVRAGEPRDFQNAVRTTEPHRSQQGQFQYVILTRVVLQAWK